MQSSEDRVERALLSLAADRRSTQPGDDDRASQSAEWDTLAAPEWPGVAAQAMLLSPSRCRALWKQFASDTNFIVQQVMPLPCLSAPAVFNEHLQPSALLVSACAASLPVSSTIVLCQLSCSLVSPLLLHSQLQQKSQQNPERHQAYTLFPRSILHDWQSLIALPAPLPLHGLLPWIPACFPECQYKPRRPGSASCLHRGQDI